MSKVTIKNPEADERVLWDGRKYKNEGQWCVSVTSVLHPEGLDFPQHLLNQYSSRGQIVHSQTEHYDKHGEWKTPEELGLDDHIATLEKGDLDLDWKSCDYLGFLNEYGDAIEYKFIEALVYNLEKKYGGRADRLGLWKGDKAVFDIKTSANYKDDRLDNYFMQMSAYANCYDGIENLVVIPLNPKTDQGFEAPKVTSKVDEYFNKFDKKLEEFFEVYKLT